MGVHEHTALERMSNDFYDLRWSESVTPVLPVPPALLACASVVKAGVRSDMHVGIVTNAPFPSENMFAREQADALTALGHEVTVFAEAEESPLWPKPAGDVVDVSWERNFDRFRHAVRDRGPDILHVQQRRGCGRVLSLSTPSVVEITSTSLRPLLTRHLALLLTMVELRRRAPVGTANRILVGTGRPADFLAPNGYSTWALEVARRRTDRPHSPRGACSVYQGTFSPLRRLDLMLDAFRLVVERIPQATLSLIGGREHDDHAALRLHVDRLGLRDNVELAPRKGPRQLIEAMVRADLAVSWIPRTHGFEHQPPLKVLDAQAAGVPVLATETQATRDLLSYGGGMTTGAVVGRFAQDWATMLDAVGREEEFPLVDRELFLEERSWRTLVERIWVPIYEKVRSSRLRRP